MTDKHGTSITVGTKLVSEQGRLQVTVTKINNGELETDKQTCRIDEPGNGIPAVHRMNQNSLNLSHWVVAKEDTQ